MAAPGSPEWLSVPTGGVRAGVILSSDGADLLSWNLTDPDLGKWELTHWRVDDGQTLRLAEFPASINPNGPDYIFHFGTDRIALGDNDVQSWHVWIQNAFSGELIKDFEPGVGFSSLTLNSDGSRIYFGRTYGMVDVWDVDSASRLNSFRVTPENAQYHPIDLDLSRDDTRLLTWGESDPMVRLWNPASGQLIQEFTSASGKVCDPTLTADNRFLVTCGEDHSALVWEVASGKQARRIPLPDATNRLQVSPDNRYLVASLIPSQTVVFDFASGRELVILPGSSTLVNNQVMGYQFSPDSRYILITIPGDKTAYGFVLDNNELVQLACQRLAAITLPGGGWGGSPAPDLSGCLE